MGETGEEKTEDEKASAEGGQLGVTPPHAKESLGPLRLKRQERRFPWNLRRDHSPPDTLVWDFWPPERRECTFLL